MREDKYKNIRWISISLLVVAVFFMFTDINKGWALALIVVAFLIAANAIDKKQKEYLNKRIDELERKIKL